METYTKWRGVDLGTVFEIEAPLGSDFSWESEIHTRSRAGRIPTLDGISPKLLVRDINIFPGPSAGSDMDEWRSAAVALFNPYTGISTLEADFDGDARSTPALISLVQQHPEVPMRASDTGFLRAKLIRLDPYWRSTTLTTSTATPLTNNGNAPAAPKITIRPTTGTVVRRRVNLVDFSSRGLINHPLRIVVNTNSVSVTGGDNIYVFDRGQAVKFQAISPPSATMPLFILVNLLPNENRTLDVVFGGAVQNDITANMLEPSGFDWAHASFTNTLWIYRNTAGTLNGLVAPSIWEIGRALRRPGSWTPTEFGGKSSTSRWVEDLNNNALTLEGRAAMQLFTQIKMANASSIVGFNANIAWDDDYAQYRRAGEALFHPSETSSTEGDIDLTDAVQAVLWSDQSSILLNQGDTVTPIPIQVALQSGEVPNIVVDGSNTTMARINGVLTNTTTGDTITFNDVFIDADASGGLIVDTNAAPGEKLRVYPSLDTSPIYSPHDAGWRFSNPAGFPLVPGSNAWTWTGDGSPVITFEFADAWV